MHIGSEFRTFYADPALLQDIDHGWVPWLVDGAGPAGDPPVELGDRVLDLGGGPATRLGGGRVLGIHVQHAPDGTDGTELPWPDGTFSAVVALLVLHHLPTAAAQDALLAECARVLRPGGVLVGLNPHDGPHLRRLDAEQRCCAIDALTFPSRLDAAGLTDVRVRVWSLVGFRARRPAGTADAHPGEEPMTTPPEASR